MRKTIILLITTLIITSSYAQSETRSVADFSILKISNAFEVILAEGDKNEVRIETTKEENLKKIITNVSGDKLSVHLQGSIKGSAKIHITYKKLRGIEQSGASKLIARKMIKADHFYLKGSGASDMTLNIEVNKLKLDFSGASTIKLTGDVSAFDLSLSGASELHAKGLKTENTTVNVSGAADVKIYVSNTLEGKVSGASSINVNGEASIANIKSSGAASISKG